MNLSNVLTTNVLITDGILVVTGMYFCRNFSSLTKTAGRSLSLTHVIYVVIYIPQIVMT
jgi:hypothetical protein